MPDPKTCIAVISTHDDPEINIKLFETFEWIYDDKKRRKQLKEFQFIFTGGTHKRVFVDGVKRTENGPKIVLDQKVKNFILNECGVTQLPSYEKGGIPILSYFLTQRICSILWQFFSPKGNSWRTPCNLALMRLCDQWHVKRLTNKRSVQIWIESEAKDDEKRNIQNCPLKLKLREGSGKGEATISFARKGRGVIRINGIKTKGSKLEVIKEFDKYIENLKPPVAFKDMTLALIAHDDMKKNMISFAIDHEWELSKFGTILATGTTGREVEANTSRLNNVHRYHSGPKGGDIEIATEILFGRCHIVIFFVDPLNPHPHIDDIRTVFEVCMIRDNTLVMTNEMHAREFLSRVVRGGKKGLV